MNNTTIASLATVSWQTKRSHRGEWYVLSSTGRYLAALSTGAEHLDATHARLMAAAPQLLAALEDLLVVTELNVDDMEPATRDAVFRARHIIDATTERGSTRSSSAAPPQPASSSTGTGGDSRPRSPSPSAPRPRDPIASPTPTAFSAKTLVDAVSAGHAIKIVSRSVEDGEHHHAIVAYEFDWSAEPSEKRPPKHERFFECGDIRR